MRPLQLRFSAFGPYPDSQSVDFERLGEAGLFVVSGPTGAGKTSVFDAMTFALYGELPGARKEYKSLRSDHADPGTLCSVSLEFIAGGQRWKVWRQPEQLRPKKRGEGTVAEKPKALLSHWVNGDWQGITNNLSDVTKRVTVLVGLTPAQFQRVMLLPQGEFQRVLRAPTRERKDLLRTLFGTDAFAVAEQHLADQSMAARKIVEQLDTERNVEITRARRNLVQAADALDVDPSEATEPEAIALALEGLTIGPLAKLAHRRDVAKDTQRKATMARQRASEQNATRLRFSKAQARRQQLRGQAEERRWGKDLAIYGRLALPVAQAQSNLSKVQCEMEEVNSRLISAVSVLGAKFRPSTVTTQAITELRIEIQRSLTEAQQHLEHQNDARRLAAEIARDTTLLDQLEENRNQVQDCLDELSERAQERGRLVDDLKAVHLDLANREAEAGRLAELLSTEAKLSKLKEQVETNSRQVADLAETKTQATSRLSLLNQVALAHARRALTQASESFEQAKAAQSQVLAAFTASTAPALAQQLVEGQECPVCGSCDHPSPALPQPGGSVGVTEVHQAQAHTLRAAETLQSRSVELETLQAGLAEELLNFDGDDLPEVSDPAAEADRLQTQIVAIDDQLESFAADANSPTVAATQLVAKLGTWVAAAPGALAEAHCQAQLKATESIAAGGELARIELEAQAQATEVAQLKAARLKAAKEQERLGATIQERSQRLEELQSSLVQMEVPAEERMRELESAATTTRRIAQVLVQKDEIQGVVERAETALAEALEGSPFATIAVATSAVIPLPEIIRLESTWDEWQKHTRDNDATIAELARLNLPEEAPDLEALTKAESEASRLADELARSHAGTEAIINSGVESLAHAKEKLAAGAEERQRAEAAYRLAEVCRGNNQQKASLETWVLATHLRDVVEQANLHLGPMSNNRYTLRVSDGSGVSRRRETGLDLEIEDAWTAKTRAVNSLSGGETFQASLALALGLADVISAGSTGVRLEALFVDEGFGSLDSDALDHAIDVLDGLRDRGALVGIITHVEAVKEALTVGLDIQRTPAGGSRLRQLV